jgi:chromate reductase
MTTNLAKVRLLAISGSIREKSTNTAILHAVQLRLDPKFRMSIFALDNIPLFNADLENDRFPASVKLLKEEITASHGIVICSPEYNYGTSGVLKNALDWASRPAFKSPLRNKPVLIVTSSPGTTGGVRANYQLRETLSATLARVVCRPQVAISGVNSKMEGGKFIDENSLNLIVEAISDLVREVELVSNAPSAANAAAV